MSLLGGNTRFVMLSLVPKSLTRMVFVAYHAGGIGGHVEINKTLLVLCLRFLWPKMRLHIIAWVIACPECIQLQNHTKVGQQLVHSWPLLTPFAIISADIWSPGDVVSPTGATCILNCMDDMCQFVVSTALTKVNSFELARAFTENDLLKFCLCLVVVVDDDSKFMSVFTQMCKALNI